MRPDLLIDLFEKEATYWWHRCRRELALALAREESLPAYGIPTGRGIDIGWGTGYTSLVFGAHMRMVGIDHAVDALALSRKRGVERLCRVDLNAPALPFLEEAFDVVFLLDVLEHLDYDVGTLVECRRLLRPGGLLIVTVPAYMTLWSPWDEAMGHRRRYTAGSLGRTIRKVALSVRRAIHSFCAILPATVCVRFGKCD